MNTENFKILNKLNKTQYYEFLRYAIGLWYYINRKPYDIISWIDTDTKKEYGITSKDSKNRNIRIIAYKFSGKELVDVYKVDTEKDYEQKTFRNESNEVYSAKDFFESIDQNLLCYILTGVLALSDNDIKSLETKYLNGLEIFSSLRPDTLNFIIGAGVNKDFGFADWDKLIEEIRRQIRNIQGISHPVAGVVDELIKFEAKMLNTNYIAPQILKDLDNNIYYKTIYNVLYGNFDPNSTNYLTIQN